MIAWAPSLDAQVTALLNKLPDASTEIRLRNDSAKSVAAYATSTRWQRQSPANPDLSELVLLFIDPTVYFLKPLNPKNGSWNVLKWLIVTGASGYAESSCHPMGELRGS